MKKLVLMGTFIVILAALSGCNTLEGFGRDVEHAGEKIQDL